MLALGLTADEHVEYLATLAGSHEIKVTVQVLDNEHRVLSVVTQILLDGQVDAKMVTVRNAEEIEVSRVCRLQLLDPTRTMTFDSASPDAGALYLDRMVRVVYSVRCPSRWVDVPVFTGPVIKCDRDGDIVNVEAHGKEEFGLGAAYSPLTLKGRKTDAIRTLLDRSGETARYVEIPASAENLTTALTVGRESKLFAKAFWVAASMNRRLFYDGRGIGRSVALSSKSVASISSGNGGLLMTDPQISFDTQNLVNIVRVVGGKPEGSKSAVVATEVAPSTHPLSPYKIGRNGKPRYLLQVYENTNLRTVAAARAAALTLLRQSLLQQIDVTYDCLPIPHLEPWDVVTVQTPNFNLAHQANSFSLPLRHDAEMTIGYQRNLSKPRRPVRRA